MNRYSSKLTALVLCLALMLPTALAAEGESDPNQPYAQRLSALGVFQGTGEGFELDRTPVRAEGVTMLVRLMGGEADAQTEAMTQTELPFTDVDAWAHGYVAYAWTQGLTKGTGDTTFGSGDPIDATMYTTFLLRCLGYSDDGEEPDFIYARAIQFAQTLGLFDEDYAAALETGTFTRGELARMSCAALEFLCKDSEKTLLETLLAGGKVTDVAAKAFFTDQTAGAGSGSGASGSGDASGTGDAPGAGDTGTSSQPVDTGATDTPEVPDTIPVYAAAPWCPDFGALYHRQTAYTAAKEGVYAYYYRDYTADEVGAYIEVLVSQGYASAPERAEGLDAFDDPMVYVAGEHITILDRDSLTGEFMVYTA